MHPDERDFDDEIRGHLALSVQEHLDRGEEPAAARLSALRELGHLPAVRASMRDVWHDPWWDAAEAFWRDVRIGFRSLLRARGLSVTVIVTLALGIGANAAIFSVVRGVLLAPLVNRGEERLVYVRQSAPGAGISNATFSMPEIRDIAAGVPTISAFGDFSTTQLTSSGIGEPRLLQAGVVGGSYFEVMGLRPVLGRLLDSRDDGPDAARAVVLTHRFWKASLNGDPGVIGRTIRLGSRDASIVGVLEPSVPYPADTEIIANVVTSPHHLGATMTTDRTHRMTELFARLPSGMTLEDAREALVAAHGDMMRRHPGAYPAGAGFELSVRPLREQITAPARPILLLLLAATGLVLVIACSNVANLILTRSVRREGELAVRVALGASPGDLRRTLLAESLILCGAGAALGVLLAQPLVAAVAGFASRYSVRALDVTVDSSLLWVSAALAVAAAVLLAFIPRLPSSGSRAAFGLEAGRLRVTPATTRRLRAFAIAQIAFSFVLLAGAGALLLTLVALQRAGSGYETRQVLTVDLPPPATGVGGAALVNLFDEVSRRISRLPGVQGVAAGSFVPWRDSGEEFRFQFAADGYTAADGEAHPYGQLRIVAPGFFRVLGVPLLAGRDFTPDDRAGSEPVVIVSRSLARRFFPGGHALERTVSWMDPVLGGPVSRRIIGIVADVDDENVMPGAAMTVYHPVRQMGFASRLFVRTEGDPYAIAPAIKEIVRGISADQAVERIATLEDVRAKRLAPERSNAVVLAAFAGVALLIASVGVAGVLAFSVSASRRELGLRLAIGSTRRHLLLRVLADAAVIVGTGIGAGAVGGYVFTGLMAGYLGDLRLPGALPLLAASVLLSGAALAAALVPAARASRVDVLQALSSE